MTNLKQKDYTVLPKLLEIKVVDIKVEKIKNRGMKRKMKKEGKDIKEGKFIIEEKEGNEIYKNMNA